MIDMPTVYSRSYANLWNFERRLLLAPSLGRQSRPVGRKRSDECTDAPKGHSHAGTYWTIVETSSHLLEHLLEHQPLYSKIANFIGARSNFLLNRSFYTMWANTFQKTLEYRRYSWNRVRPTASNFSKLLLYYFFFLNRFEFNHHYFIERFRRTLGDSRVDFQSIQIRGENAVSPKGRSDRFCFFN